MEMARSRLTPRYCPEYPTCAGAYAALRVYSYSIAPEAMTAMLGLEPHHTMTKGLPHTLPSGGMREVGINGWFLSSHGQVSSKDLRDHLDWLLERLRPAAAALTGLQAEDVSMAAWCIWHSAFGHGGPSLWPEQLRRLAELNLECAFDIYLLGEGEPDIDVVAAAGLLPIA
jgi:hypothetical protein